jgi:hypothetical protein
MSAGRQFDDRTVVACAINRMSVHGHLMEVRRLEVERLQ